MCFENRFDLAPPERRSASRIRAAWAGPFGAVSRVDRPILVDRRAANHRQDTIPMGDRVRQALEYDDAASFAANKSIRVRSKVLQRPLGDMNPTFDIETIGSGVIISETPPVIAISVLPKRRL